VLALSRMYSQDSGSSLAECALVVAGFLLAASVVGLVAGIFFGPVPILLEALVAKKNSIAVTYERVTSKLK
jgi:hypothetical protein